MLKSTDNAMSREQFTKLRDARRLIEEEFRESFSLESDTVVSDLYDFALRSSANELFDLFEALQLISDKPVPQPLTKEQFVVLREARELIRREFDVELPLRAQDVMDRLDEFARRASDEVLLDLYVYLGTRRDHPKMRAEITPSVGARIVKLREAQRLIKEGFDEDVVLTGESVADTVAEFAGRSDHGELRTIVEFLQQWTPGMQPGSALLFDELSAADFDRLREAKRAIAEEFDAGLSLHSDSSLDDLYRFSLESEEARLFELFADLIEAQWAAHADARPERNWLSKDQYVLLREARTSIRDEFDESISMQSETLQDDLYQFALKSEREDLFDVCNEFHRLRGAEGLTHDLPSKEEFRMLRRGRALIAEEFDEELQLQSDVLQSDLYRFAVRSESDELFDLHADLMGLSERATPESVSGMLLSKEELAMLRGVRTLVREEFGDELMLDAEDVLDRVYGYALRSTGEELFDLHARLNADAQRDAETHIDVDIGKIPSAGGAPVDADPGKDDDASAEALEAEAPVRADAPKTGLKKWFSFGGNKRNKRKEVTTRERVGAVLALEPDAEPEPAGVIAPVAAEPVEKQAPPELDAAPDETAGVTHDAGDSDDGERQPERREGNAFGDRLVRAMEQKPRTSGTNPKGRGQRSKKSGGAGAGRGEASWRDPIRTSVPVQPAPASSWYVSSSDGRFGVRLLDDMSVGLDGEMFVGPAGMDLGCPTIELSGGQPVLTTKEATARVNETSVEGEYHLASGDLVVVGEVVLRVEFQPGQSPAHSAQAERASS